MGWVGNAARTGEMESVNNVTVISERELFEDLI